MKAILIMAAGTPADTLRLASGERIGGMWRFATASARTERFAEMATVLAPHGLRLAQCEVSNLACSTYGVTQAMEVIPIN